MLEDKMNKLKKDSWQFATIKTKTHIKNTNRLFVKNNNKNH